jgi:cytochrome c
MLASIEEVEILAEWLEPRLIEQGGVAVSNEMQNLTRKHMAKNLIVATALIAASAVPSAAQDAQKGKVVANVCLACHSIGPDAQNKIGPELNGLDGRHSGSVPNFKYTKDYTDPGVVWNKETFEKYIKNPRAMFPDTTMIFLGIQNEQQVNDLWAYVSQFDADGNIKK